MSDIKYILDLTIGEMIDRMMDENNWMILLDDDTKYSMLNITKNNRYHRISKKTKRYHQISKDICEYRWNFKKMIQK